MPAALIDAADLRFPPICAACGAPAESSYTIQPTKGFTLVLFDVVRWLDIPVPVCLRCRGRRRLAGRIGWTSALVFLVVGAFAAFQLLMDGSTIPAVLIAVLVGSDALVTRLFLDDLLDWAVLGVRVAWQQGAETRLTVTIKNDGYFAAWASSNATARIVP